MDSKRKLIRVSVALLTLVLTFGSFLPAQASTGLSLSADTSVFLSGSGITLTLASGGTLSSYSVSTSTLAVALEASNSVTIKSVNLYTINNSQGLGTLCSASPAFSYVTFTATSTMAVTITPNTTIACANTGPVISAFAASPASITSGQSSSLSWSISGADTVSIDNGIGAQSNATSSSVRSVTPTQTTTYTVTAANGFGTTTAQTTVTVTTPSGGGGGGGGGGIISTTPTITSFSASPASIAPGQSTVLTWSVSGASSVSIVPSAGTSTLNSASGTATVAPATTTVFTLTATNAYGQSSHSSTTVTVSGSGLSLPSPGDSQPSSSTASNAPAYCLVNRSGTFYLILNGVRHGIANPGLLYSYGYGFGDATMDTQGYQQLPEGGILGPNNGALVKTPTDPTVYLISGGAKHGLVSATVFASLGYKFSQVLTVPTAQLRDLQIGDIISSKASRHLPGMNISSNGTVYYLGSDFMYPYPSLSVYNSWNLKNDFSRVVSANKADLALPTGLAVTPRSSCSSQ